MVNINVKKRTASLPPSISFHFATD